MKRSLVLLAVGGCLAITGSSARAGGPVAPTEGFAASRYEPLWTKSPFSVASDAAPVESPDYSLVGIARFDGVSYASLVEKRSQEHFLLATGQPARGLTLVSITEGPEATDVLAVVSMDGQLITLKCKQPLLAAANTAPKPDPFPGMFGYKPQK